MTQMSSKDVVLLVDGYSLAGFDVEVTVTKEAVLEEEPAFGNTWAVHRDTGIRMAEITQNGFFDDASNANNAALNEQQGVERVLVLAMEGNTIDQQFVGFSGAMQVNFNRISSRGTLHRINVKYSGSGIVEEGDILHDLSAETAASGENEADSVDGGAGNAPSTDGGSGYLEVSSLTLGGYTSVTIKIRDSSDDITFGDLLSFTNVTGRTAERVTVAGDVERYLSISWAFNGAGAGQSITFLVGFSRN